METPLEFATITELAAQMRTGAVSPVKLAEASLDRIRALDKRLHAFIAVSADRALAEARAAETLLKHGHDLGPLQGVPYAVKDLYDVKGIATTAGTRLLHDNVAAVDCSAVRRLASAGMVLVGKTHTVQFAFGGVGIKHDYGPHHNTWSAMQQAPSGTSIDYGETVGRGIVRMAIGGVDDG